MLASDSSRQVQTARPQLQIGVTGGIGSGKSTVTRMLAESWPAASIIDADAVAKSVTAANGVAIPAIQAQFGAEAITTAGALDRQYMRELITQSHEAKQQLEAIVHPLIRQELDRQSHEAQSAVVLFDVPLLVESGDSWLLKLDSVLVVDCSKATQLQRVLNRESSKHWSKEQVQSIMAMQATREQRRACADAVVLNDDVDLATLQQICTDLVSAWGC